LETVVRMWDAVTGRSIGKPFSGGSVSVWKAVFSPDGKRIAAAGSGNAVVLLDSVTGEPVGALNHPITH
jgi:hypothetical protein